MEPMHIYTDSREMGTRIKFYMRVINSHKIYVRWMRVVKQIDDEGHLRRRKGAAGEMTVDMHMPPSVKNFYLDFRFIRYI